jgi:tetrahydromethanopterin S-methyltransferase subunit B
LIWNRLSDWIHGIANGRVAISALIAFLLFTALVLPGQASSVAANTQDAASPDTSFYYTAVDLYQMASEYGEEGREAYIQARFTFDLIWPLVYAVFLSTSISWTYRRAFALESLWQRANVVPVLAALFDYLENISTSLVMFRYPIATPVLDSSAGIITMVKWVFVVGSFALLLIGMILGVARRVSARDWR